MAVSVRACLSSWREAVFAVALLITTIGFTQIHRLKDMFEKFLAEEMKVNTKQEHGE
jgi:hypothetical protein